MGRERTCAGPECAARGGTAPAKPVVFATAAWVKSPPHWGPPDSFPSSPGSVANTARRTPALPPGPLDAPGPREPREGLGTSARRRAGGLPSASAACSGRLRTNAMDARRFQASVQRGFCLGDSGLGQGGRRVEPWVEDGSLREEFGARERPGRKQWALDPALSPACDPVWTVVTSAKPPLCRRGR